MLLISRVAVLLILSSSLFLSLVYAKEPMVVVNGEKLNPQQIRQLISAGISVAPGRYWYDHLSGLWGYEKGPTMGQLTPGLPAAPMPENISTEGMGTQVFINGRQLHPKECQYLFALYGRVIPGRYWMNAQGVGGFEGGPPFFNIKAAESQRNNRSNISGHWLRGGSVIGDGSTTGFISSDGMSVTCGPDGGCIY